MSTNPKSTQDAPPESPARDAPPTAEAAPYTAFAAVFQKGLERIAELQKNTLDIVAKQTTDMLGAWKQAYPVPAASPGAPLLDMVDQGIERLAQTQKGMIDLVVHQSAQALDLAKDRRDSTSKWNAGVAGMMSEAADRTVAVHKILLDFAAEQNKVMAAAIKKQAGVAGAAPAAETVDAIQRNVDLAIQTQKELMEAAAKPLKAAAGKQAA
jgi:hypothetical protein